MSVKEFQLMMKTATDHQVLAATVAFTNCMPKEANGPLRTAPHVDIMEKCMKDVAASIKQDKPAAGWHHQGTH